MRKIKGTWRLRTAKQDIEIIDSDIDDVYCIFQQIDAEDNIL